MPYRATLPVRSKRGAVQQDVSDALAPLGGVNDSGGALLLLAHGGPSPGKELALMSGRDPTWRAARTRRMLRTSVSDDAGVELDFRLIFAP